MSTEIKSTKLKNTVHLSESAQVDSGSVQPFTRSQKIYVQGSRPDIRVPMREISLDVTPTEFGGEINAPVVVYDTSGPYTDPNVIIDVRKGLADVRSPWIEERGDTERLACLSSRYGQERLDNPDLAYLRQRQPDALRAQRHHHARNGIRGHPRKHEA